MMLYWEWGASLLLLAGWRAQRGEKLGVFFLLLLPRGRRIPTSFPALLPPSFPVIPAAPLTPILALDLAAR